MSIDRSLRVKSALVRHRNVLSRAERVEQLKKDEKWAEDDSVFGLPKVAHRKSHAGQKAKEAPAKEAAPEVAAGTGPAESEQKKAEKQDVGRAKMDRK